MAIKKGAFDLYTQERQLPNKKPLNQSKTKHFFDDVDKTAIGSGLTQKPITNNSSPKSISEKNNFTNGSQSVHNQFTNDNSDPIGHQINQSKQALKDKTSNGSQSVHDRFTIDNSDLISEQTSKDKQALKDNTSNGSQSVHDRFTINNSDPISDQTNQIKQTLNNNTDNSPQSVHNEITYSDINVLDARISELEKTPKICFSKLVGNQREIVIALYKNMKINKSDTTDELTLESISKLTGVNQKSLKNTLFRLSNAGLLIRADQKVGRGGWVKYQLNIHIIKEIQQKEFFR